MLPQGEPKKLVLFWVLFGLAMVGVLGGWYAMNADSFATVKDAIQTQAAVEEVSEPLTPIIEEAEEVMQEAEDTFVERVRDDFQQQQEAAAGAVLTEAVLSEISNEAEENYAEEETSEEGGEENHQVN